MTYSSRAVRRPYTVSPSLNALNAAIAVDVGDCATLAFGVLSVNAANMQLVAEGQLSDNGPWLLLDVRPTNDTAPTTPLAQTPAITTLPTNGWRANVQGMSKARVRVSAYTAGSLVVETRLSDKVYCA